MEKEHLQNQLNKLWEKVQEDMNLSHSPFERAQAEIQRETVQILRSRFEKEKSYWENLVSAKEESLHQLQREVEDWQKKYEEMKNKLTELQNNQTLLVQQSFSTLDLQRKSLSAHIEKLERDLSDARKEILELAIQLKEEKAEKEKWLGEFEEKERNWLAEKEKGEMLVAQTKKELFEKRQTELDEIAKLEQTILDLKNELQKSKEVFETERSGLQALLQEKDAQIEKFKIELSQLQSRMENERKEKEMAALERERQLTEEREDKKRLVEQLLTRENKIKELQDSLEKTVSAQAAREEALEKREEEMLLQEEALRKRREEWVQSIKEQSGQQLNISGRVVELLNKLELKMGPRAASPSPPPLPPPQFSPHPAPLPSSEWVWKKRSVIFEFFKTKKGMILLSIGCLLFLFALLLIFFESKGIKTSRAIKQMDEGNQYFTQGDLEKALDSFQKAYKLDPENSMVKNSLTLTLAELAHREFRDGKYEEALKRTVFLSKILPQDPEVLALHQSVLQALGRQQSQ